MAYIIVPELCTKDNLCFEACPEACISPAEGDANYEASESLFINPDGCTDCSVCVVVCPSDAIYLADDVPAEYTDAIAKNKAYFN